MKDTLKIALFVAIVTIVFMLAHAALYGQSAEPLRCTPMCRPVVAEDHPRSSS